MCADPALNGPVVTASIRPLRSRWPPAVGEPAAAAGVSAAAAGVSAAEADPFRAGVSAFVAPVPSLHAVSVPVATARTASEASVCRMRMREPPWSGRVALTLGRGWMVRTGSGAGGTAMAVPGRRVPEGAPAELARTELFSVDAYLRDFEARVEDVDAAGHRVRLARTAFYPG